MSCRPLIFLAWMCLLAGGCSREAQPPAQPAELRVLCGSSMATPAQILCRRFKENQGIEVLVDLGGSETLLPRILSGASADIFICHDPFEQKIKEAGRWAGSARVGLLQPVLLVRPGNPLKLKCLSDLTNRTLKIGIGDPRYSTCGAIFRERLDQKGLRDAVMKQVTLQARAHAELANGLIVGALDAVVVWNYVALMYPGKVEVVPTADPYPEINVTVVGLTQSQNPGLRDAFLNACRTDSTRALFAEHGYRQSILTTAGHAASTPPGRVASEVSPVASSSPVPEAQSARSMAFRVSAHAQFIAPDAAVISWETDEPGESLIEYGIGEKWDRRVRDAGLQTIHRISARGLEPKARYQYRIRTNPSEQGAMVSEAIDLDNAVNYTVPGVPDPTSPFGFEVDSRKYSQAAEQILSQTGVTRGYCLILDCDEGQLAYELAKRSELILIGVDHDGDRISRARARLRKAGVYGSRITVHQADSLDRLPFPRSFANLIVAGVSPAAIKLPATAAQVLPLLQPATGVACLGPWRSAARPEITQRIEQWLGQMKVRWNLADSDAGVWLLARRDLPPDTGSWTHQYGDAGNSANSQEGLQGANGTDGLEVQWLGRPGADFGLDRNPRMPAPLAVNGRLFHQGLNRIIALDSYNGAVLWSLEIPALRRVNMPRDASNWCADPDHLFVAVKDRCWVIAAGTGELSRTFPLADPGLRSSHEWGYVGRVGDLLYGSSVKQGAAYTNFWGKESWYDATSGPGTEKVCSDDLYALSSERGDRRWLYRGGVVINSTIGITGGKVLFVECRHPEVAALATSRIGTPKLWQNQYLVALDARTGDKLWDQAIDTVDGIVVFYLLAAEDKVFIASSAGGQYHLYAFSAADGKSLWQSAHAWSRDNHGGHMQHPVVVGHTVFLEPCGYDAATGKLLTQEVGRHGGCATYAATLNALIYRGEGGHISMWDIHRGAVSSWYNLRPSCWLSTVPANGMVLSPESGGGCSCGNWLETSLGFAPVLSSTPK